MMEAVDSNYCGGREVGAVWAMLGPTKTLFIQIICSLSQDVYFVSAVFVFDQTSSASAAARWPAMGWNRRKPIRKCAVKSASFTSSHLIGSWLNISPWPSPMTSTIIHWVMSTFKFIILNNCVDTHPNVRQVVRCCVWSRTCGPCCRSGRARSWSTACRWGPGRRRGWGPAGWCRPCPPAPPPWRSTGTAGPAPSPRTSSPPESEQDRVKIFSVTVKYFLWR